MKVSLSRTRWISVLSCKQASKIVTDEIARTGMGSLEWSTLGAGRIMVSGHQVAHVSYNGRVWEGNKDSVLEPKEITW